MKKSAQLLITSLLLISTFVNCRKSSTEETEPNGTAEIPAIYKKIYGALSVTSDGIYITIKTNGLPDHKSVYYATSNALYESFSGTTFGNTTFAKNPNTIASQSLTFKIPADPKQAALHASTPLGPIGVSLNGVPFFNQYAAMGAPLTNEITSFDKFWGHPQQSGQYHYHITITDPYLNGTGFYGTAGTVTQ